MHVKNCPPCISYTNNNYWLVIKFHACVMWRPTSTTGVMLKHFENRVCAFSTSTDRSCARPYTRTQINQEKFTFPVLWTLGGWRLHDSRVHVRILHIVNISFRVIEKIGILNYSFLSNKRVYFLKL